MYGYVIPSYAKEWQHKFKQYDPKLRLRWSVDQAPGRFLLERKTIYFYLPDWVERGTDRAIQLKDCYRKVMVVAPNELRYVLESLALTDIQRLGGAKVLAERLLLAEDKEMELMDRQRNADLEAVSSEAYDYLAWREQRRISMGGYGV